MVINLQILGGKGGGGGEGFLDRLNFFVWPGEA